MQKTILITGASSGIGHATAIYFAEKGWNVVATMRHPEKEKELIGFENVYVIKLDVRDVESIREAIRCGIRQFETIDVVLNNAAYGEYGIFEAVSMDLIRAQFETNVFGLMNVIRSILPCFRNQESGMIINVSSAGGRIGLPQMSAYSASKFAVEGFSESLSYELASQNIILKIIEPGGVNTPFIQKVADKLENQIDFPSYDEFIEKASDGTAFMIDENITPRAVAETIYQAATDGSSKLRYQSLNDSAWWLHARTHLGDDDYMDYMEDVVGLKPYWDGQLSL
jgi:NAD(P)-dependent dehydrogenase (short-subunit alcohol dehydrogenase family)